MPALRSEEVRTQVHRALNGRARESEHQDLRWLVQPSRGRGGSEELPRQLRGVGRFECQVKCVPETHLDKFFTRMRQRVKDDFESMAAQTRRSVTDEEGEAQHSVRDFAWRLVFLGRVFDAMPGCQDLVRMEINILLDTFLEMPWGYMYVFKLGMVLEKGEWFQDDQVEDRPRKTEDERTGGSSL